MSNQAVVFDFLQTDEVLPLKDFERDFYEVPDGFDLEKLRLNIGSGGIKFSNCLNIELEPHKDVEAEFYGDITKGINFKDETFSEVLMIHVIEHIERKYHTLVFEEIWRVLKPNGRVVLGFPDAIECMKRFIDNRFGGRWSIYHQCLWGRQARNGDFHVTAMERQDITNRLMNCGFVDINYLQNTINVTMTAKKGKKLRRYL